MEAIITALVIGWLAYFCYASGEIKTQREIIKELEAQVAALRKEAGK
jgi:hypothetical protein